MHDAHDDEDPGVCSRPLALPRQERAHPLAGAMLGVHCPLGNRKDSLNHDISEPPALSIIHNLLEHHHWDVQHATAQEQLLCELEHECPDLGQDFGWLDDCGVPKEFSGLQHHLDALIVKTEVDACGIQM